MKVKVDPTPEQREWLNQALGANKAQYNGSIAAYRLAHQSFRNYELTLGFVEGWDRCEEKRRPRNVWELRDWARLWGLVVVVVRLTAKSVPRDESRWGIGCAGNGRMSVRFKMGLDEGSPRPDSLMRFLAGDERLITWTTTFVEALGSSNPFAYYGDVKTEAADRIRTSLDYQGIRDGINRRAPTPYMDYLPGAAARDTTAAMKAALTRAIKGKGGFPRYKGRYQSRLSMSMSPGGPVRGPRLGPGPVDWDAVARQYGSEWEYADDRCTPMMSREARAKAEEDGLYLFRNGGQIDVRPWTRGPDAKTKNGTYTEGARTSILWRDSVRIPWSQGYKGDRWIPCSRSGYLPRPGQGRHVKYSAVCVSREGDDFYVSITCSFDVPDPKPRNGRTCGVDVGIADNLATVGSTDRDPHHALHPTRYAEQLNRIRRLERRLMLIQRRASRRRGPVVLDAMGRATRARQEPSRSWVETNRQAAEIQRRLGRMRADLRHQTTARIVRTGCSEFVHEGLDLSRLLDKEPSETRKDRGLRQTFRRIGAGEIFRQIAYKAEWAGATARSAFSAYSSKQCPVLLGGCGRVNDAHKIANRLFRCPSCGFGIHFGTEPVDSGLPNNHRDVVAQANLRGPQSSEETRRSTFEKRIPSETIPRTRDRQGSPKKESNRKRVSTETKTDRIEHR